MNVRGALDVQLSESNLALASAEIERPAYDRKRIDIGIVHFGPGAFHRAHQAHFIDHMLSSDPRWGISGVSLQSPALRDALAPQDGLYTLAVVDQTPSFRVIGAQKEILAARDEQQKVFARLSDPRTRIVTMTVTEKGYCLNGAGDLDLGHPDIKRDLASPRAPQGLIGHVVEGLRRRRDLRLKPFTVISCDNLAQNGVRLRNASIAFASEIDRDLARWIEDTVAFPCTMVDSITPATDDALRQRVRQATGLSDAWPVQREAFVQWVIERHHGERPDWESAGVTVSDDVEAFERAKLRLLNGAHSSLAYLGLLRGHDTVAAAMKDEALVAFVRRLMADVMATLRAPRGLNLTDYVEAILTRFRNPAIEHRLSQIAWDGSQKLPIRILGSLSDNLRAGRSIDQFCLTLAAWMHFVRIQAHKHQPIVDPLAQTLSEMGANCRNEGSDVSRFLSLERVFDQNLAANPDLRDRLVAAYTKLAANPRAI